MSTAYVSTEVEVLPGFSLYIDGNSKVTASNGTFENPKPNAFSLPHISTCPGSTEICRSSCYVHGLSNHAAEVYERYRQNERVLHRLLMTERSMSQSADALGQWVSDNCRGGFRWHVSGDLIHTRHMSWIATVCIASLKVRHWIYTRSLDVIASAWIPRNMTVNISADRENYREARAVALSRGLRVCYLSDDGSVPPDMQPGEVIFPDYSLRGRDLDNPTDHSWWQGLSQSHRKMVCPPDFFGQSEAHRCGPCNKCIRPIGGKS